MFTFSSGLGSQNCYATSKYSNHFYFICLGKTTKNKPKILLSFFRFGRTSRTELNHFAHIVKRQASLDRDPWGAVSPHSSSSATVFFAFFSPSPLSTTKHCPSSHSYPHSHAALSSN
jgi:hypothetical protein